MPRPGKGMGQPLAQTLGKAEKTNVAVMRPTVNVKEAEEIGSHLPALTPGDTSVPKVDPLAKRSPFSRHGTFLNTQHPLAKALDHEGGNYD
jgi:hypothetical protein